jgi:hypothetical protein
VPASEQQMTESNDRAEPPAHAVTAIPEGAMVRGLFNLPGFQGLLLPPLGLSGTLCAHFEIPSPIIRGAQRGPGDVDTLAPGVGLIFAEVEQPVDKEIWLAGGIGVHLEIEPLPQTQRPELTKWIMQLHQSPGTES